MIKKVLYCVMNLGVLAVSAYGSVANIIRFVNDWRDDAVFGTLLKDGTFTVVFLVLSVLMVIFCFRRIARLITDIKINKENK